MYDNIAFKWICTELPPTKENVFIDEKLVGTIEKNYNDKWQYFSLNRKELSFPCSNLEDLENRVVTGNQLSPEQIKNWRRVLSAMLGPYAFIMSNEQIQQQRDVMQKRITKETKQ